jgi:hypothetical protein
MICTPASTHAAVARDWLTVGYQGPLFVEKPLACSVAECKVFKTWPHPVVSVGYNWRYNRELGAFRVSLPNSDWCLQLVCATDMKAWPGRGYASPLLECSHELDLALSWDPRLRLVDAGPHGETGAYLMLLSETNQVEIELAWRAPADRWLTSCDLVGQLTLCHPSAASISQSYIDELGAWIWDIEHEKPAASRLASNVDDGLAVLAIVEQAQRRLAA